MQKQTSNISGDGNPKKVPKRNATDLKKTVTEIMNPFDTTKERISELEDLSIESLKTM